MKDSKIGREQKESDAALYVPADYLGDYGERWIVYDNVVRPILELLEVAARVERPDNVAALDVAFLPHPIEYYVVDWRRGVAVVGRQLGFELLHEFLVVMQRVLPASGFAGGCLSCRLEVVFGE